MSRQENSVVSRKKSGRAWPIGIAAFLGIFVVLNVALLLASLGEPTDLVSKQYYREGYNLRDVAEQRLRADAIGWKLSFEHRNGAAPSQAHVRVGIVDRNGAPCDSVTGRVTLYRPSSAALDIHDLTLFAASDGSYRLNLPRPLEGGAWQAIVSLERGSDTLEQRYPFFVTR